MRICKKCNIEKEYNYFTLDARGRSVYKDEQGKIWHGKTCASCFADYVKMKAGKQPLSTAVCPACHIEFKQKNSKHVFCSKPCFKTTK